MATTKPRATQIRGLAKQQAPYLFNIIPDSYLPDSTGDVDVYGEFFTPDMTVSADGQTVNYFTFINSGHIKVNMTRGSAEGNFGLTLDNGIEAYFPDVMLVVLGEVFRPDDSQWSNIVGNPDLTEAGSFKIGTYSASNEGIYTRELDITKDFAVRWKTKPSQFGEILNEYRRPQILLNKVSDNSNLFAAFYLLLGSGTIQMQFKSPESNYGQQYNETLATGQTSEEKLAELSYEYRYVGGIMSLLRNGQILYSWTSTVINENLKLKIHLESFNVTDIKYIELAT